MWTLVMSGVHEGLEDRKFSEPAGLTTVTYCLDSGLLATDYCRMDRGGTVQPEEPSSRRCADRILHQPHGGDHCYGMPGPAPILDGNGEETGLYHLAGEFCPEESRQEVSLLGYQREDVGAPAQRTPSIFWV